MTTTIKNTAALAHKPYTHVSPLLTQKQINTKTNGIVSRAKHLSADVQTVMIHQAGHALESGDVRAMNRLVEATTKVLDRKALIKFAVEYCLVQIKADGTFKVNKARRDTAVKDYVSGEAFVQHLEATAPQWDDMRAKPEDIAKELDVAKRLESIAKAIINAAKNDSNTNVVFNVKSFNTALENINSALKAA